MSLYRHIVVGTDFSSQADLAVNSAISLAVQHSARLSLLHIIDERVMQYNEVLPLSPGEMEEMLRQETKRKLSDLLEAQDLEDLAYEVHVIFGKPHVEIDKYCAENDGELVVLGQRSEKLLKQLLLGSTAERLLRHTRVPTLLVAPDGNLKWENILAPVDFSETSKSSLEHAIQLAKDSNAELHVLHVSEDTPFASLAGLLPLNETDNIRDTYEANIQEEFDKFLSSVDFRGVKYVREFRRGAASTEIKLVAESTKADIIVMGSVGRTGVRGILIGNTAERVARTLQCSLLTIKAAE